VLIEVGLLNPSRLLAAKDGAEQIGEVGDPRTERGFKQVAAMDPVLRVKAGEHYPPVLLSVGLCARGAVEQRQVRRDGNGRLAIDAGVDPHRGRGWPHLHHGQRDGTAIRGLLRWAEAMLSPESAR